MYKTMNRWVTTLVGGRRSAAWKRPTRRRPGLESLEVRSLPSATPLAPLAAEASRTAAVAPLAPAAREGAIIVQHGVRTATDGAIIVHFKAPAATRVDSSASLAVELVSRSSSRSGVALDGMNRPPGKSAGRGIGIEGQEDRLGDGLIGPAPRAEHGGDDDPCPSPHGPPIPPAPHAQARSMASSARASGVGELAVFTPTSKEAKGKAASSTKAADGPHTDVTQWVETSVEGIIMEKIGLGTRASAYVTAWELIGGVNGAAAGFAAGTAFLNPVGGAGVGTVLGIKGGELVGELTEDFFYEYFGEETTLEKQESQPSEPDPDTGSGTLEPDPDTGTDDDPGSSDDPDADGDGDDNDEGDDNGDGDDGDGDDDDDDDDYPNPFESNAVLAWLAGQQHSVAEGVVHDGWDV
jgi:hypothetical protein